MHAPIVTEAFQVTARSSDRGLMVFRQGDRFVLRGRAAGNRGKAARLTLLVGAEKISVNVERGATPHTTLALLTAKLPQGVTIDRAGEDVAGAVAFVVRPASVFDYGTRSRPETASVDA